MNDAFIKIDVEAIAESVEEAVMRRVESSLERLFREGVRVAFSEKEAAAQLGVSPKELYRKRAAQEIGYYQNGRKISYGLHHLLDYLARSEVKTIAPSKFEMSPRVSLLGAEIRPTLRKVG